jgi:hypothetical protein
MTTLLYILLQSLVFCLVYYNWPHIVRGWHWLLARLGVNQMALHHPPGDKRNNLELFGKIDTSKTKPLISDD